ncbi:lipid A export permease/ATP-binding protein MsbA [Abyssibacter profundi]|uniref:Lipid A export permease/ATP-binding protein MsbA n=1 Tax=Abyssibacter profundi TaxID=2182787 RepID=A0A363UK97_9GAMM|nr:lipid A export permease/ATP-binding protein MsbA [Abyssibacter profundi]MBV60523.1 lipid A export permease/ATP-binding protein MsbA [Nevskiales bacterium]PWN55838.1 lipid A export permease/ATP-binding protein MsbA [Abyssibacter profundi]
MTDVLTGDSDPTPRQVYRRLLGYATPHWRMFLLAIVGMTLLSAADVGLTALMQPLLDGSFVERDPKIIRLMPIAILVLFLTRGVAQLTASYCMAWVGRKVIKTIRTDLFSQYLRLPVSFFDREAGGQLIARLTYHVDQVAESTTSAIGTVIKDGLTVIGLLCLIVYLNWKLACFVLVVGPLIAGLVRIVSRRFRKLSRRIQNSMGNTVHVADEVISGHRVVKVFGGQTLEAERFEEVNEYNRRQHLKMVLSQVGSTALIQWIAAFAISAIVFIATTQPTMTPGAFAAFMGGLIGLLRPLRNLTTVNERIQRGISAAAEIFDLLDQTPEQDTGQRVIDRVNGELVFDAVSLRYTDSSKPAVNGVDLTVPAGQVVAFVGRSGSGKTSLLSLIPRFYQPSSGEIRLDGHALEDYELTSLRRQIALVDQSVTLFNATVGENIAYGVGRPVSDEDIRQAARSAHALEFIERLEQGFDTQIGQNGVLLSGGQRQRIAIARAILKDAPILILDEATSALDTESERKIQAALEGLMKGRTTLVIAHRLSTIQNADLIVVMDDGRVVEQGTHTDLLRRNGAYAALHQLQFEDD